MWYYLLFYLICAYISAGINYAYFQREFPVGAKQDKGLDLVICWLLSMIFSPVALFLTYFLTDFAKHGFIHPLPEKIKEKFHDLQAKFQA